MKGGSLAYDYVMRLRNEKCIKSGGGKYKNKEWKELIDKCSKTNKNMRSINKCASKFFNKKYPQKHRTSKLRSKKHTSKNKKKMKGGGSDWAHTLYSRGPVNNPSTYNEQMFRIFNKKGKFYSTQGKLNQIGKGRKTTKKLKSKTKSKTKSTKTKSCLPIKNINQYKKNYIVINNLNEYRDILPYSEKTKQKIDKIKVGLIYTEKGTKSKNCIVNIGLAKKPAPIKVGYLDENNPYDIIYDKKLLANKNFGDKIKHKKKTYTVVPDIYITTRSLKNIDSKGGFSEPLSTFLNFFK